MQPTKTQAIANFLRAKARPEFADLYGPQMEVQVMVCQDNGERVDGEYEGHRWSGWTDGITTWKAFRIPFKANTNPEYRDTEIKWDLAAHAEAIGMTGWDWVNKKSRWVAFDFDAIMGHAETHTAKLTDEQLAEVRDSAIKIPWVTVRQSTSGNGLHLYVFLDGVDTQNHTEHQALGRAILGKMSSLSGYDFNAKVDNCGGNIWVWHRKYQAVGGIVGPGLRLIKKGEVLTDIPANWRDHIKVAAGKTKRSTPSFIEGDEPLEQFLEMCGQRPYVTLDADHIQLIKWVDENRAAHHDSWWDGDQNMFVCHTLDLKSAHEALHLKGIFDTKTSDSSAQNCYMFPLRKGGWIVRRHSQGVQEADNWCQDDSGWTRCYLNRYPDLYTAAKYKGSVENEKGAFVFREAEVAASAASALGAHVEIPAWISARTAQLRSHKDGRLIFEIEWSDKDDPNKMPGWVKTKRGGMWQRILNVQTEFRGDQEVKSYEDIVRHLVADGSDKDAGWVIKSGQSWCEERMEHVKCVLASLGLPDSEIKMAIGGGVLQKWTIVNRPFQPEYPGNRIWNRNAVQFAFAPSPDTENLYFDQWTKVLDHCGSGLDEAIGKHPWCVKNGIKKGGDYLKLWVAWMFQHPLEQLPYLFFYGPEGSGKSIFHEALEVLLTKGVGRADSALVSPSGFNGELIGKILCVVEETDLRQGKGSALNRIKDWVTAKNAPIHKKNGTPYTVPNSWHWCQTANDIGFCPTFPGDTRIVVAFVKQLLADSKINKSQLLERLRKQAPDFLAHILHIDLPQPDDRLSIPVIVTEEKKQAQASNRSVIEEFLAENTFPVDGQMIKMGELHERFQSWLPPSMVNEWTIIRFGREMVKLGYVKGRNTKDGANFYIGNISYENCAPGRRFILNGDKLGYTN